MSKDSASSKTRSKVEAMVMKQCRGVFISV